ncbi:hypothetical protein SARC_11810 [Sphaeroforma arctica JP610]|uniref:PROP1-like PPR domain-containing protein n=1 Tax=Sphaeroforma arctica JP610 TaxID=667725 RepID=A0A0L0FFX3_9EUKA|nr:hypothetical protein SARC_11810 [Sphaeroforma arctica JP610]KNC75669.1 hypothetical protein SARC_11810 [Sphaeroforma arctica JP610]|eukprot:XP_014149571.1 hypothetical protein SARC_11810 [Sphaeroforma arctica JP610]
MCIERTRYVSANARFEVFRTCPLRGYTTGNGRSTSEIGRQRRVNNTRTKISSNAVDSSTDQSTGTLVLSRMRRNKHRDCSGSDSTLPKVTVRNGPPFDATVGGRGRVNVRRISPQERGNGKKYSTALYSKVSLTQLEETAKRTKNYREVARVVDRLLDNRTLRMSDGVLAVNIYKQNRQPDKCLRVLTYVYDNGGRLNAYHYTPCIAALSANNEFAKAHLLFEEMQIRGVNPNVVTYTSVIQVLLKEGKANKAIALFRRMSVAGVEPNAWTYSTLMSVFNRTGQWEDAILLYEEMESKGLKHNTVTYSAAITACEKGSQWSKAIEIFNEMGREGILQDTIAYSATISACEKGGQWHKAVELFDEMEVKGIEQNTIAYSATISACEKGRQWHRAVELFDQMGIEGIERNTIAYSATISACEKGGQCIKAMDLFNEMENKGVQRNTITYSAIISAYEKVGQWSKAMNLFNEMESKGIEQDTIAYSAAISACEKGGQSQMALALFDEMGDRNIEKIEGSYGAVIQALGADGREQSRIDSIYNDLIVNVPAFAKDWHVFSSTGVLDLHDHTVFMAQAAIRRLLRELQTHGRNTTRAQNAKLKYIIVGKGNNSAEQAVLLRAVQTQLETLTPPVASHTLPANTGCMGLNQSDLTNWLRENGTS